MEGEIESEGRAGGKARGVEGMSEAERARERRRAGREEPARKLSNVLSKIAILSQNAVLYQ